MAKHGVKRALKSLSRLSASGPSGYPKKEQKLNPGFEFLTHNPDGSKKSVPTLDSLRAKKAVRPNIGKHNPFKP